MNQLDIKLVCVGDGAVGKTCILLSYVNNEFPQGYVPTIFDNYVMDIKYKNKDIALSLWDTAGQEEYQKLRTISYPLTDIFLIIFDISNNQSYINATNKWLKEISQHKQSKILFVLNKIDLLKNKNENFVDLQKAKKHIKELGYNYFECSALTQQGLKKLFDQAVQLVFEKTNKKKRKFYCNFI